MPQPPGVELIPAELQQCMTSVSGRFYEIDDPDIGFPIVNATHSQNLSTR